MSLRSAVLSYASRENDSDELRLEKITILLVASSCCLCGCVWGAMYWAIFGLGLTTILPLSFVVIVGATILISAKLRNHRPLVYAQLFCITFISAFIEWSIGGIADAGLVICWSFLGPIGALFFLTVRQAIIWLFIFLALLGPTIVFDEELSARALHAGPAAIKLFFAMNVGMPAIVVFGAAAYFVKRTQSLGRTLAIANRQMEDELEMARKIQQSLIPESPPKVSGLRTAARYRAMQRVGGDFYDFRAGPNTLGVLMADVSGHGVPAALIVSMVHLAFSFQREDLKSPDIIFKRMNEILYGNIADEFVTACYVHFDTTSSSLVTGNAGHPPVMVWRKRSQELIKLRPLGRIIGFLPSTNFETARIQLEAGDRVLIYTDGALEASNAEEEFFGEERLAAALRQNQDNDPEQFVEDLIQTLLDWSGGPEKIDDDIAIVAVDYTG